jgi:hypothetical protein
MRGTLRTLVIAGMAIAVLGVGAASASAVTVQDNGITCGDPLGGGPAGSGNPFTGGCAVTAHSNSSVLVAGGQTLDCVVDITDARVSGDGDIGINGVVVSAGASANCALVEPCLDPPLPWSGSVGGTGPFTAKIDFCVDTPLGTFSGETIGELRNADDTTTPPTPPQIEFHNAPIGSSGATLDGIYNLSPTTLSVS